MMVSKSCYRSKDWHKIYWFGEKSPEKRHPTNVSMETYVKRNDEEDDDDDDGDDDG